MSSHVKYNRFFFKLLGLSLALHGVIIFLFIQGLPEKNTLVDKRQVVVTLAQPPEKAPIPKAEPNEIQEDPIAEQPIVEEPLLKQEEAHQVVHNSDEFASNNQNKDLSLEGKPTTGGGTGSKEEQLSESKEESDAQEANDASEVSSDSVEELVAEESGESSSQDNDQLAVLKEVVTSENESAPIFFPYGAEKMDFSQHELVDNQQGSNAQLDDSNFDINALPEDEELEIPLDILDGVGNLELLSDNELSDALVEQPFSEKESNELKLVNRYLARMNEQVLSFWVNPYQGSQMLKGIIKVELDVSGNLVHSFIYRSSGHRLLDISVLDAIRAVPRFEVPDSEIITRQYYSNLSFHYSSKDEETELMPFEEEPGQTTN